MATFSGDSLVAAVGVIVVYMQFGLRQILRSSMDFPVGCCCPARHVCLVVVVVGRGVCVVMYCILL
jgi:hypothetical protein